MNDTELQTAIAELLGWTHVNMGNVWLSDPPLPEILVGKHPVHKILQPVPRYTEDLNAIQDAVNSLNGIEQDAFAEELCRVVFPNTPFQDLATYEVVCATARQRAEALYLTLK